MFVKRMLRSTSSSSVPSEHPPQELQSGFICPECLYSGDSADDLLQHFLKHNLKADKARQEGRTTEGPSLASGSKVRLISSSSLQSVLSEANEANDVSEAIVKEVINDVVEDVCVAGEVGLLLSDCLESLERHECVEALLRESVDLVTDQAQAAPLVTGAAITFELPPTAKPSELPRSSEKKIAGSVPTISVVQSPPMSGVQLVNDVAVDPGSPALSIPLVPLQPTPKSEAGASSKTAETIVQSQPPEPVSKASSNSASRAQTQLPQQPERVVKSGLGVDCLGVESQKPSEYEVFLRCRREFAFKYLVAVYKNHMRLNLLRKFTRWKMYDQYLQLKKSDGDAAMLDSSSKSKSTDTVLLKDVKDYAPYFKMMKAKVPRPAIELKMKQNGLDPKYLDNDPDSVAPSELLPPPVNVVEILKLKDDEQYGPFFKMLKAKVPRPAIELKMKQMGLDVSYLDKDPDAPAPNQPTDGASSPVLLRDCSEYGPFLKMLKAKVPRPAIEFKMSQKGLDPGYLDKDPSSESPIQPSATSRESKVVTLEEDEVYGPYLKMLKAKVPRPAIELKMKQNGLDVSFLDKDPSSPSPNQPKENSVVMLKDDERYGPFLKMLKAKVPRPAIELKMKQKGLDPSYLDKEPNSPAPPKADASNNKDFIKLKDDEDYGPYFKMLKAKVPRPAVELKMKQNGLDPSYLDKDPESPAPSRSSNKESAADVISLADCEQYGPFLKMLKAKVPRPAIELKMKQKGLDPSFLDKNPSSPSPVQPSTSVKTISLADCEEYGPFLKMLKAKVPRPAIELKMKQKGLDPSYLDKDPSSPSPVAPSGSEPAVALADCENYGPFLKMLKAKVPRPAIELKMKQKGLDPSFLDKDPSSPSPCKPKEEGVALKDDEDYGPFIKMLKAKVPRPAVELKMKQKGLDPSFLDKDPDSPAPRKAKSVKKAAEKKEKKETKPKKPAVLRRKLHWRKLGKFALDKGNNVWKKCLEFEFEQKEIEELNRLFVQQVVAKAKKVTKAAPKKKKTSLLEMQRANNVSIVLSRMKEWFSGPVIQRALCTLKVPKGASVEDLRTVLALLPSDQEEKTLQGFKGNRKTLGLPEQYFLSVMDISRYRVKVQCFLYKLKFDEVYDTINDDCEFLSRACTDIAESDKLVRLFEVVLALGNFMNETKTRVQGFSLDSLRGLGAVKSFVGNTTALNYLALVVSTRQRQVLDFVNSERDKYRAASNISFSYTLAQLKTLENGLVMIEREYNRLHDLLAEKNVDGSSQVQSEIQRINQKTIAEEDRVFYFGITTLYKSTKEKLGTLVPKAQETEKKFNEVLEYFCAEPTLSCADFFGFIQEFMGAFQEAVRENDAARAKCMKRARLRHMKDKKKSEAQAQAEKDKANVTVDQTRMARHSTVIQRPRNEKLLANTKAENQSMYTSSRKLEIQE